MQFPEVTSVMKKIAEKEEGDVFGWGVPEK